MKLADHPTAKAFYEKAAAGDALPGSRQPKVEADWLRHLALDTGADDAGIVEIARPALAPQRDEILRNYPWTKSLLSFVVRMAREPVRGAPRSVANLEFHRAGDEVNQVGAAIIAALEAHGIQAVNPSMGFPMEMYQVGGGAIWVVSHKPVAVEAGLGHMGIHRNLIHPRFGNFVLLGTVLMDCDASNYDHPLGPYLHDKERHLQEVVKPLQERAEPVYVVPGSDAEAIARRKFRNKTVKPVGNGLRPRSIAGLLALMPHVFQPNQSRGLAATFHFTFTGAEAREVTIRIHNRMLAITEGLVGTPDVHVTADANTWLGFLAKERSLIPAVLRRRIRVNGNPKLLLAFGKCFPTAGPRREPIEIVPQSSRLRLMSSRYQKNDPATGRIRWLGKLTLADVEDVTYNIKTFRFKPPDGGEIPFDYLPGQFLTLHISPRGVPTTRSYTIASTPTWRDRIEITVKREPQGLVSRWLHDVLGVGDEVEIEAPNGTFIFNGEQAAAVALIGAGVGITPMMSVARYLTEIGWPGRVSLILGFRAPRDFIFREELDALKARNPSLSVTVTMSNPGHEPWSGIRGRIDAALLASAVSDVASRRVHVCGPPSMMDAVKAAVVGLGVGEAHVKTEAFGTITRDPTVKGGRSARVAGTVVFQASDTTVRVPVDATILDVADDVGVFIDNACRSGTCGSCRVKLVSGPVSMAVEDALTEQDKVEGYILACQATIRGDVKVDA